MSDASTGWGVTRFHYTKKESDAIYMALDLNNNSIVKAFDVVWDGGPFKFRPRDEAAFVLRLIEKIHALRVIHGRNSDRIWNAMMKEAKQNGEFKYDRS